jgi:3-hydroxyisobutyrate dehydrogenase-like beta-hydroxyacid dehydrogenase
VAGIPAGIANASSDRSAVTGADVVLSINAAAVAFDVAAGVADELGADTLYFAELFRPLGMPVEVVGSRAGDAAGLKLLRSVFMKGTAAAAIESLEAARAAGVEDRVRADIGAILGEPLLERLLSGSRVHAARRVDEMRAAAAYVEELGVHPRVVSAAAEWLAELADLDPDEAVRLERPE